MFGVNGKPYESLDHLLDIEALKGLDTEICLGMAHMNRQSFIDGSGHLAKGLIYEPSYDFRFKDHMLIEQSLSEEELAIVKSIEKPDAKHRYMMMKYGAYFPWVFCLTILGPPGWLNKMESEGKFISEEAQERFPKTIEFIYNMPIFESIGRIMIFGNYPNHHVDIHKDSLPSRWPHINELLWLNPVKGKPFFVFDETTETRHYVDGYTAVFDDLDFHGVDAVPYFNYTIRVDGKYRSDIRQQLTFGRQSTL